IPLARVGSINEPDGLAALRTLDADVVFVIGWSQILRPAALRLARTGMIGAHASLLPQLRGSAPINWALIRGERQTGNSLSWLAGRRWTIWHAAHLPGENGAALHATPGEVLGPMVSPVEATCGQMVACGAGAVVLLELQAEDGTVLRGRELSDQPWTGKRWGEERETS